MFSKKDFQVWGKQNAVLFAAVMTKIDGRKDDDLLRTYGFRGFPSMAILDADGAAITKKVPRDLYSMRNIVAAAPTYVKLKAEVDAGTDVDKGQWLMAQLGMGELGAAEAREQLAGADLDDATRATAEQMLFVVEMQELSGTLRGRDVSAEAKTAACAAVYEAFKAGKRLPEGAAPEQFVDDMLIEAAKDNSDGEAFFFAYERVKARFLERIEMMKDYLPRYREDIEKLEGDDQKVERAKSALKRVGEFIADAEKQVAELDALAKKLKK
ncbi:MAG: hypothetical protein KDC98_17115 [Planctomycetes bacterium]|nr:hypothetical protein [Planctomycetota bacterium]